VSFENWVRRLFRPGGGIQFLTGLPSPCLLEPSEHGLAVDVWQGGGNFCEIPTDLTMSGAHKRLLVRSAEYADKFIPRIFGVVFDGPPFQNRCIYFHKPKRTCSVTALVSSLFASGERYALSRGGCSCRRRLLPVSSFGGELTDAFHRCPAVRPKGFDPTTSGGGGRKGDPGRGGDWPRNITSGLGKG